MQARRSCDQCGGVEGAAYGHEKRRSGATLLSFFHGGVDATSMFPTPERVQPPGKGG